ncbi:MAG: FG-GAP-like repeat-containing protein [Wenzhouxiangellaceae bacterium]
MTTAGVQAQWVNFADETSTRFPADLLADPYEKDFIFGDVDRNGFDDLIVVRMLPFAAAGGLDVTDGPQRNYLLLNFDGRFYDCSAGAPECDAAGITSDPIPGFASPGMDRDVFLADINEDGWDDIVTTTTFGDQPQVYLNQKQTGGVWNGFQQVSGAIPSFSSGPRFCAAGFGDVSGDGIADILFTEYAGFLDDRLLIGNGDGTFEDLTDTRMDDVVAEARFGTDAHIVDMDGDGDKDIVKVSGSTCGTPCDDDPGSASGVWVHYNEDGEFRSATSFKVYDRAPYMTEPGDFDGDGNIDLYIVDDNRDHLLMNRGGRNDFSEIEIAESPKTDKWGGNVKIADIDADDALDVAVADVDTDAPGCKGAPTPDNWLVLLRGQKTGPGDYRLFDPVALDLGLTTESAWTASLPDWLNQGVYDFDFVDVDADRCLDLVIGQCTVGTDDLEGVALSAADSSDHLDGYKVFMQRYPGISYTIDEPAGDVLLPAVGDARFMVKISVTSPSSLTPRPADFNVRIGGADAVVESASRVGRQVWLVVQPPASIDRAAEHRLEVVMERCSSAPPTVEGGLVRFGDPERTDAVLAIDLSTSMDENRKIDAAKNAASLWVDKMNDEDRIGLVWFSGIGSDGFGVANEAHSDLLGGPYSISAAGDTRIVGGADVTNRQIAIAAIYGMDTISNTPIGEGLRRSLAEINEFDPVDRQRALVLLSDGQENVGRFWGSPPASAFPAPPHTPVRESFGMSSANANVDIHTISFGPTADRGLMTRIAERTSNGEHEPIELAPAGIDMAMFSTVREAGAIYTQSGPPQPLNLSLANRLANVYEHLHNASSSQQRLWQTVHDSRGSGANEPVLGRREPLDQAVAVPVLADNNGGSAQATKQAVHWQDIPPVRGDSLLIPFEPGLARATLSVNWESGVEFDASLTPAPGGSPAVRKVRAGTNLVFHIDNPTAGDWRLDLRGPKGRELLVALSGTGRIQGFAGTARSSTDVWAPGAQVPVALALFDRNAPVTNAVVGAIASSSSGDEMIGLRDDGTAPDDLAGDGVYTGLVTKTANGGGIGIEILAAWTGADGAARQRIFRTSAVLPELDSDGDGISDEDERASNGLLDPDDPADAHRDPDGDGLATWKEIAYETLDPRNPDTDGDGVEDGAELCAGTDPTVPGDADALARDSDSDGMPDIWEERYGLDPEEASDASGDIDRDGLTNLDEFEYCTSPRIADSDGDGRSDGSEVETGTSPSDGIGVEAGAPAPKDGTPDDGMPDDEMPEDRVSDKAMNPAIFHFLCLLIVAILLVVILIQGIRILRLRRTHP